MRLYQFLKDQFNLTKSEVEAFNINHNVKVNTFGPKWLSYIIKEKDIISVDNKEYMPITNKKVYLLFNKPRGVVCTNDRLIENNIRDYISYPIRIYPCGRLDKESNGLILLTNDGSIINEILDQKYHVKKYYHVYVDKPLTKDFKENMEKGVKILNHITLPCKVEITGEYSFDITLIQGLNRQIRRMCKTFNYNVISLERFRIGTLYLDNLKSGSYKEIKKKDIDELIKNKNMEYEI